jgi:antitoxin component YwqK of YwqJK toxin-antitoxin module
MKTLLLTISLTFSLLASAQIPMTAVNCADDKEGIRPGKLFDSEGTPWNLSGIKDMYYLNGAPYTGIVKACNTGKVLSKKSYVDGVLDGLSYKYHKDGWLLWKKNYASGDLDGEVIHYYSDGTTKSKENYASGQLDGEVIKYFADGTKKSEENYSAGKQDGTQKFFYSNGIRKEVYFCNSDGKKHGLHKYYYKKDTKKCIETYLNGVLDGKQEYFDRNEQLIEEKIIESGVQIEEKIIESGVQTSGYKLCTNGSDSLLVWFEDFVPMTWDDAMAACETLGDGWHLPTKDELNVLYQNKENVSGILLNAIYWSSTVDEVNSARVWARGFDTGHWHSYLKKGTGGVRAVRTLNP